MRVASLFSGIGGLDWGLLKVLTGLIISKSPVMSSCARRGFFLCRAAMKLHCSAKMTLEPNKWGSSFAEASNKLIIWMHLLIIDCNLCLWFVHPQAATFSVQVLKEHFPGVLLVPDICSLQCLPGVRLTSPQHCPTQGEAALESCPCLQGIDLVAAGFPCTDVSRAGLRKGLQGKVALSMTQIACLHSWQLDLLC